MYRLTFASGKQIDATSCGEAEGALVIKADKQAFSDTTSAVSVLTDPGETAVVDCEYGGEVKRRYEGFVVLVYFDAINGYTAILRRHE